MLRALAHHRPPRSAWAGEIALFALALVVYQASRALVVGSPGTAFQNAKSLIGFEKGSGLFVETSIQERVLDHVRLVEGLNLFYLSAHWIVTPLFFVWLYRRRRDVYPLVRNAFLIANGIAIVVFIYGGGQGSQTAVPVAEEILSFYFDQEHSGD